VFEEDIKKEGFGWC